MLKSQYQLIFGYRVISFLILAFCTQITLAGTTLAADESKIAAADKNTDNPPILIEADQLISNNEEQFAEFIGNVKASQADFVMTADKLRIYYQGELLETEETTNKTEDKLKKIVASGNVKINSSEYKAESDRVEYDTVAMTITMYGESSKVISGKNSIAGSKIILYRNSGRVKVLGSKKKRVEARFFSGGSAADAFKIEKPQE